MTTLLPRPVPPGSGAAAPPTDPADLLHPVGPAALQGLATTAASPDRADPAAAERADRTARIVLADRTGSLGVERILLRPVGPADRTAMRDFLAGLSLESAYRRFFTGIGSPSSTLVRRLVEVDHDRRSATVALAGEQIVGLADTAIITEDTVELGVVIADHWQRRGLGPRLIAAALAPAIARGCTTLRAHTLFDNARVARLIRTRWPAADPVRDDDSLVWTLPLT